MITQKLLHATLLCCLFHANLAQSAEDAYICISEQATGFFFENGKWGRANFDTAEDKFLIRKITEKDGKYLNDQGRDYGVFELGKNSTYKMCDLRGKNIICTWGLGDLYFSPESGRFLKTYMVGYWEGQNNNDDTPSMTIGRCSKL